jgi:hypothetical protein
MSMSATRILFRSVVYVMFNIQMLYLFFFLRHKAILLRCAILCEMFNDVMYD